MKRLVTILCCFVALAVSVSASAALYPIDTVVVGDEDSLLVNPADTLDEWNIEKPFVEEADTFQVPEVTAVDSVVAVSEDSVAVDTVAVLDVLDDAMLAADDVPAVKPVRRHAPSVHRNAVYAAPVTKSVATEPKPVATEQKSVVAEPEPVVAEQKKDSATSEPVVAEQKKDSTASEPAVAQKENKPNNSDYTMTIPIWLFALIAVIVVALIALVVFYARKASYLRERVAELKGEVMYLNNMRTVKREMESEQEAQNETVIMTEPVVAPAPEEPKVEEKPASVVAQETISFVAPAVSKSSASTDKQVQQLVKNIEKHISEPDLGVEQLAAAMNMSRSQLYNLCNDVLDQTPAAFILDVRLKRAMQLIETRQYKMNEVSAKVGFVDAKYFAKVFKKKTGMTPSQYMERPIVNK